MQRQVARRDFLFGMGAATAATAALSLPLKELCAADLLYPPRNLSYFDTPISPAPGEIHFGYASITWNENDRQAIDDIAALGFPGIQLRSNVLKEFSGPAELRDLLEKRHLKMVALSSGGVNIGAPVESEEIAKHAAHAKFVHDVGGLYLQVTDERPKDRAVTSEDYVRLGKLITEIGKRTADLGVTLGYHNHMGTLGQSPEEVDQILQAADSRYAKLELDVAHYLQGGGDPAKAIEKYHDRLLFLHIKDVESLPNAENPKRNYRFVELGRGRVDLPAVFAALGKVDFRGWAIVELDAVPDKSRTPKESGEISKKYLEEKLKVAV
ncbi:MAG TPA: sugar phosphate isomerase/epimerase [Candidatus Acidoferrum sp.]|nr:sugar phosphate isomerase/epimerase [Candidatus Acidoferrum sp.]